MDCHGDKGIPFEVEDGEKDISIMQEWNIVAMQGNRRDSLVKSEECISKENAPIDTLSSKFPNDEPLFDLQSSLMDGYAFEKNILVSSNSRVLIHKNWVVEEISINSLLEKEDENFICSPR